MTYTISDVKKAILDSNANIDLIISTYLDEFIQQLMQYKIDWQSLNGDYDKLIAKVEESIKELQPIGNDFLNLLRLTVKSETLCMGEIYVNFFETLLQKYEDNEIILYSGDTIDIMAYDNYRFFNHQFFLSVVAILIENERFDVVAKLVNSRLIIIRKRGLTMPEDTNFIRFREYNYTLSSCKNEKYNLRRVSVAADFMKSLSIAPSFDELIKADILLYYLSLLYPGDNFLDRYWYPDLSCYNRTFEILPKLIKKSYFEKAKVMFDVDSVDDLRSKYAGLDNKFAYDGLHTVPRVSVGLCFDKIATV